MSKQILVIGHGGKTGRRVYQLLQQQQIEVRGASRSSSPAFDWYDESTWAAPLQVIDSVFITFQPDLAVPNSANIISSFVNYARAAGISKLVLLSGRGETEAIACENIVKSSGLDFVIIRASFFMQNFSEGFWADGIQAGDFIIPKITAKEPFVDVDDIAEVVVHALLHARHNGNTYEMTGPELLNFADVIAKISSGIGREITLTEISVEAYATMLREYQVREDMIWLIKYLFTEVLDGRNESVKHDIEQVLGRKPTSFSEFVRKMKD